MSTFEERKKIVAERILKNLSRSPRHAHMGALQRIELAYSMATAELLAGPEPPDDADAEALAQMGFLTEIQGG